MITDIWRDFDKDKYESMRLLFLDFIESASDEVDEEAWRDKLTMLDELLFEVKRLREQFKLAYDWVDYQFPDGGISDFARYIGDEEE